MNKKFVEFKKKRIADINWFNIRAKLINKARARFPHDKITPVGGRKSFQTAFRTYGDAIYLWYDTGDGSTHIEKEYICKRNTQK